MGTGGPYVPPSYHASLEPLGGPLYQVCGSGENDLYVMSSILLHYDGAKWLPVPVPRELEFGGNAVSLESGELIMSTGRDIFVHRNDEWTTMTRAPEPFNFLTGSSPDNLYCLHWSSVQRYDGTSWVKLPVEKADELSDIAVNSAGTGAAVGYFGRVDRFDGSAWATSYLDSFSDYNSVAVTPSGRVFVAGYTAIWEIIGSQPVRILRDRIVEWPIIRTDGEALYSVGQSWNQSNSHLVGRYADGSWITIAGGTGRFNDLWVDQGKIVGVGDEGFMWRGNDAGGKAVELYPTYSEFEDAVRIGDAIYTIGPSAYRFENGVWTDLKKEFITRQTAYALDGRTPDNIYAVGNEMILHYDGDAWTWVNSGHNTRLGGVWAQESGDVVAVGEDDGHPVMVEFDGLEWKKRVVSLASGIFHDVWGVGDLVVAVGTGGLIGMRQKDGHWNLLRPTNASLVAVWGFDERHIYAASSNPNEICVYDGYRWDSMFIQGPEVSSMRSIWGTSPSNLFVLDYYGNLVHFDGRTWTQEERILHYQLSTVCGNGRDVLVLGRYGSVLYSP